MGKIGIIDADLVFRPKHRFPNLACEKISGFYKEQGNEVELITGEKAKTLLSDDPSLIINERWLRESYLHEYDHLYISKVFTDTPVNRLFEGNPKYHYGGTGFYFDQAPPLPDEIEHHKPDYELYDLWIQEECERVAKERGDSFRLSSFMSQFREYKEYSIGFLTRGCFRHCKFCVNQKYNRVFPHSPLEEFYEPTRKKICMLDDNFLGYRNWRSSLETVLETKKPFKFKQGLDERILDDEKCKLLFNANYDGDFTFAFDKIQDYDIIHKKLALIRKYTDSINIKFYVLVGFDSVDANDIENAFKRIALLMEYKCLPYIMRFQNKDSAPWAKSNLRHMYVAIARWVNQPNMFKKMSFRQFCEANQALHKTKGTLCSAMSACAYFEEHFPEIAKKYFDLRYADHEL